MLEFKNVTGVSKGFNLKDISFNAPKGYITAIVGANGAGKSTLLNYIFDMKKHYSGEILYDGKDIRENFNEFRNITSFISDERRFFEENTASENAKLLSNFYDKWNQELFNKCMKELSVPKNTKLSKLSRGEYIKFQLALSVAHDTKLYLLDEATAGMDPVFRKDFYKFLHELIATEEVTILTVTHIEEDIYSHMDYVGTLKNGEIISFKEAERTDFDGTIS